MNEANIGDFYQCGLQELRVPLRLLHFALSRKQTRALHLLLVLKGKGSRVKREGLSDLLQVSDKTLSRRISELKRLGWIGADDRYLFPRSWRRIGHSKRGGLTLDSKFLKSLDRVEAFALAGSIKRLYRRKEYRARKSGRAVPKVFPSGYFSRALELSKRTFERHKCKAIRHGWIRSKTIYRSLGKANEYDQIKKNLHGPFVLRKGLHTVTPEACKIDVLI